MQNEVHYKCKISVDNSWAKYLEARKWWKYCWVDYSTNGIGNIIWAKPCIQYVKIQKCLKKTPDVKSKKYNKKVPRHTKNNSELFH